MTWGDKYKKDEGRKVATYLQIQDWIRAKYGFTVKTCWIAHVKETSGLPIRKAPNRRGKIRMNPCPPDKAEYIKNALKHFGMI